MSRKSRIREKDKVYYGALNIPYDGPIDREQIIFPPERIKDITALGMIAGEQ